MRAAKHSLPSESVWSRLLVPRFIRPDRVGHQASCYTMSCPAVAGTISGRRDYQNSRNGWNGVLGSAPHAGGSGGVPFVGLLHRFGGEPKKSHPGALALSSKYCCLECCRWLSSFP